MTILTPDADLSTDLLFVTPDVDRLTVFEKLSVVSLSGSMSQIYLNGYKIEVSVSFGTRHFLLTYILVQ